MLISDVVSATTVIAKVVYFLVLSKTVAGKTFEEGGFVGGLVEGDRLGGGAVQRGLHGLRQSML